MIEKVPGTTPPTEYIDRTKVVNFWNHKSNSGQDVGIKMLLEGPHETFLWFPTTVARDAANVWLSQSPKGKPMKTVIADLQTYLRENRDMVYSVGLLLLIDHFVFDGAFRERLRKLVEGFLVKTEAKAGIINATATRVE